MALTERLLSPEASEDWIRDCLRLDPAGVQITVTGTCMEPALMEGSKIILKPPAARPRLGDVVLLRTPGGLRLHRVLLLFRDILRTKGDRGTYLDPASSQAAVIAVWDTHESARMRSWHAGRSLARLLARPWIAGRAKDRRDGAHARLLP